MSNLDTKLREIIEIVHEGCLLNRPCPVENQAIRAIKEAFEDEGYIAAKRAAGVEDEK